MEDGVGDGGSSSAYSPSHSNRRYPLSVGTAVVGGGHCDRPAPRVIDREASHAPAASVAPCGNGWSGGSSGGGGGVGSFFGKLILRLAGMAVAGAAAALGVAAVSSVSGLADKLARCWPGWTLTESSLAGWHDIGPPGMHDSVAPMMVLHRSSMTGQSIRDWACV